MNNNIYNKSMVMVNIVTSFTLLLVFLAVGLSFKISPLSRALFTPETTLIDEQFNVPATSSFSGIGVFTSSLPYSDQPLFGDVYSVYPGGTMPVVAHPNWPNAPIDNTGWFGANLAGFVDLASANFILKTTVNLNAGKTYKFTANAATPISNAIDPKIGLTIDGVLQGYTKTITTPTLYDVFFTATKTGPQVLSLLSLAQGDGGNDIMFNYVTLTEGTTDNKSPIAVNDSYTTAADTAINISPLDLDTDPDNDPLIISRINGIDVITGNEVSGATSIITPNGKVTITKAGVVTFTPNPGFNGVETFSYEISDEKGGTAKGEIKIAVGTIPNQLPIAVDDKYTLVNIKTLKLNPLNGDSDPDGTIKLTSLDGVSIVDGQAVSIQVDGGVVDVDATGVPTFTANPNFNDEFQFDYEITDDKGGKATAKQIIDVLIAVPVVTPPPVPVQVPPVVTPPAPVGGQVPPPITPEPEEDADPQTQATPRTGGVIQTSVLSVFVLFSVLVLTIYKFNKKNTIKED